jgi:DNA-binding NarL/FixJ family response regulator
VSGVRVQTHAGTSRRSAIETPNCPHLTDRELEVVNLMAEALTNQQIASKLGISSNTVRRHAANLFAKLGAVSRLDAVRRSIELHLV